MAATTKSVPDAIPPRELFLPLTYYKENPIRGIKFQDFDRCLRKYPEYMALTDAARFNLIESLEGGCYRHAINIAEKNSIVPPISELIWFHEFAMLYCDTCFNALSKFDLGQGVMARRLLTRMLTDALSAESIAEMTGEEYAPELYREHREKYIAVSSISESFKTSELYTCYRCGKNQCIVEKNPCRSADEQIPLRITCMFCNNKWSG